MLKQKDCINQNVDMDSINKIYTYKYKYIYIYIYVDMEKILVATKIIYFSCQIKILGVTIYHITMWQRFD